MYNQIFGAFEGPGDPVGVKIRHETILEGRNLKRQH